MAQSILARDFDDLSAHDGGHGPGQAGQVGRAVDRRVRSILELLAANVQDDGVHVGPDILNNSVHGGHDLDPREGGVLDLVQGAKKSALIKFPSSRNDETFHLNRSLLKIFRSLRIAKDF